MLASHAIALQPGIYNGTVLEDAPWISAERNHSVIMLAICGVPRIQTLAWLPDDLVAFL